MNYITDSIGEDYKNWALDYEDRVRLGKPSVIFLSSPTGSGKTTFVLDTFLSYLVKNQKKALYLVNRSILKKQLDKKIERFPYEQRTAIDVELYQMLEDKIIKNSNMGGYNEYDCVICDEAHYFLMDSNYNTKTILSYNFVRIFFSKKLRIYMSATIEEIKEVIEKDIEESVYSRTPWLGIHTAEISRNDLFSKSRSLTYKADRNYDYIKINLLREEEDISKLVVQGSEKWLIFVDNKEFGRKLKEEILSKSKEKKKKVCEFITSSYEDKQESVDEVDNIVRSNIASVKVLIATSVLDNGIDIKDNGLRNVIIIADTETEFIQMLGRKRRDDKPVKLYIYKQTENHFRKRLDVNKRKLRIAEENYDRIKEEVKTFVEGGLWTVSLDKVYEKERNSIINQHVFLMSRQMEDVDYHKDITASFVSLNGILFLNLLAFKNLENLGQFYGKMIDNFEKYGKNAFLWEQLGWLGKTDEEKRSLIDKLDKSQFERSQQIIIKKLEEFEGKEITKEKNIEIKKQIKEDLIILIEAVDDECPDKKRYLNSVKKRERAISKDCMDFLSKHCEIPFKIVQGNESPYRIQHT